MRRALLLPGATAQASRCEEIRAFQLVNDANAFSFAHYMIGEIFDEHTKKDIEDAQDLGLDAFALNISTEPKSVEIAVIPDS